MSDATAAKRSACRAAYSSDPVPPLLKPVIPTRSVSTFSSARTSPTSASKAGPAGSSHHMPFACG